MITAGESEAAPFPALCAEAKVSCDLRRWESYRLDEDSGGSQLILPVTFELSPSAQSFFEHIRAHAVVHPTLAIVGIGVPDKFLETVFSTVDDFIIAPVRVAEFCSRVHRLLIKTPGHESIEARLLDEAGLSQLVGDDPVFLESIRHLALFARTEAPVLINGETGTGKELCARAMHHLSTRRNFPFVPVDCSALPDHLFENEMFGHARGAYTDAHADQKGLVAMAEGGTLFLDEIDSLSMGAQAKLLRVLQERMYKPLGSDRFRRCDINVIVATNTNLDECVHRKQFRSDLYFRLNVMQLRLPPLRERIGDIDPLARHFLRILVPPSAGKKQLSPSALRKLKSHQWPGNVRELSNVIHRAAVLCEQAAVILPSHVILPLGVPSPQADATFRQARAQAIESFERSFIEELLSRHDGNISHAARAAGQERRSFGRLVKKYQLARKK